MIALLKFSAQTVLKTKQDSEIRLQLWGFPKGGKIDFQLLPISDSRIALWRTTRTEIQTASGNQFWVEHTVAMHDASIDKIELGLRAMRGSRNLPMVIPTVPTVVINSQTYKANRPSETETG